MMSTKPEQYLKIGDWWYLPQQDKLVKLNDQGEITETAIFDNLCQKAMHYFIANAGRLITRDELLADVWGVRDVSDGRISRVIRVLRNTLGDNSREPIYIETISKRGFRFIAPIAEVAVSEASPTEIAVAQTSSQSSSQSFSQNSSQSADQIAGESTAPAIPNAVIVTTKRFRMKWGALLVSIAALCLFMLIKFWPSQEQHSQPFVRYSAITSLVGLEFDPAVSPDGRYLAFVYRPEQAAGTQLMLQDLQTNEIRVLFGSDHAISGPSWHPQAESIAFMHTQRGQKCEILSVPIELGHTGHASAEQLTECGINTLAGRLNWSSDGEFLVYPSWEAQEQSMHLKMLKLIGGQQERLTVPPQTSFGDYAARFAKNGKHLAFLRYMGDGTAQIWLIDLETRASRKIVHLHGSTPFNIDFWDENHLVFPTSSAELRSINIHTLEETVLAHTESVAHEVVVTAQQKIFVSMGELRKTNIKKISNPMFAKVEDSRLIYQSSRNDSSAVASPKDDGPVAVFSSRSSLPQIWFYYPDGKQVQVSHFTQVHSLRTMEFSPDGERLLANVGDAIWIFSSEHEPVKLSMPNQTVLEPSWSADGAQVYFVSGEKGRWQVLKANVATGEQTFVSNRLDYYRESSDGVYQVIRDVTLNKYFLTFTGRDERIELPISSESYMHPHMVLRAEHLYFSFNTQQQSFSILSYHIKTGVLQDTGLKIPNSTRRFTVSNSEMYILLPVGDYGNLDVAEVILP